MKEIGSSRPGPSSDPVPPLVYVWAGAQFPQYGYQSLRRARQVYEGPIYLVADKNPGIRGIDFFPTQALLLSKFKRFEANFSLDTSFRDGLWLKAYQRFFLLEEFANTLGLNAGFAAELDTWIFDFENYFHSLNLYGKGLFVPGIDQTTAIASLIYWNVGTALSALTDWFLEDGGAQNEMNSIGNYLNQGNAVYSFPTEQSLSRSDWLYFQQSPPRTVGIVDGAGLGQWLFGLGPATTKLTTWTRHRRNSVKSWPIDRLSVKLLRRGQDLVVESANAGKVKIRILHVPSKIHNRLRVGVFFRLYLLANKLGIRLPVHVRTHAVKRWVFRRLIAITRLFPLSFGYSYSNSLKSRILLDAVGSDVIVPESDLKRLSADLLGRQCETPIVKLLIEPGSRSGDPESYPTFSHSQFLNSKSRKARWVTLGLKEARKLLASGAISLGLKNESIENEIFSHPSDWPILLCQSAAIKRIILSDINYSSRFEKIVFSQEKTFLVVARRKKIYSAQHLAQRGSTFRQRYPIAFSSRIQVYDADLLRELFNDSDAIQQWWASCREGEPLVNLADFYGGSVISNPPKKLILIVE